MRKIILCVGLLLVMAASSAAEAGYRLRAPGAETYLRAVPHILELAGSSRGELTDLQHLLYRTMPSEIRWRFHDLSSLDAELLYRSFGYLLEDSDRDFWGEAIVLALMTHAEHDLSEAATLSVEDFRVALTPRDYNGDGQHEWMAEVTSDMYTRHLVVQQEAGAYRIVDSPLPWFGCCFAYWDPTSGFMEEQLFADMTGDGQPEWVLASGGVGGGHQDHGHLHILTWDNGRLIDLTPPVSTWAEGRVQGMTYSAAGGGGVSLFPYGVEVSFADTNDDGRIEVIITQQFHDNWGCEPTETRLFGWSPAAGHFALSEHLWDYPDTAQCALRRAQDAMWHEDYEAAIPLLEHSLALYAGQTGVETYAVYAGIRLALAYALTGRGAQAADLLDTLKPDEALPPIDALAMHARAAYNRHNSAFELCLSMYDTFDRYFRSDWLADTYWGVTSDVGMLGWSMSPRGDAGRAGCPAPAVLNALLTAPLTTHGSLVEQLASRGIFPARTGATDLNGDGLEDWLIALDADLSFILLVSADDQNVYQVVRVDIPNAYLFETVRPWRLPDNSPALLGYFYEEAASTSRRRDQPFLPPPTCPDTGIAGAPGGVVMIALEADQSAFAQEFALCEPRALDSIFPDGEGSSIIHAWFAEFDAQQWIYEPYQPVVLRWDADQRRYTPVRAAELPHPEVTETPAQPPEQDWAADPQRTFASTIRAPFDAGDYADVLDAVHVFTETAGERLPAFSTAALYHRALALEALGRDDEALTQYVAIYQAAPESAWGVLAALHFEAP